MLHNAGTTLFAGVDGLQMHLWLSRYITLHSPPSQAWGAASTWSQRVAQGDHTPPLGTVSAGPPSPRGEAGADCFPFAAGNYEIQGVAAT